MRRIAIGVAIFVVFVLAPVPARAQGYIAPFFGFDFGGDAGNCPVGLADCSNSRTNYGVALGHLSHGLFGFEGEFSYAPHFFGDSPSIGASNVAAFMGNLMLAAPLGPVHPYVSGGLGVMVSKFEFNLQSVNESNTSFAYNAGGGLLVFLPVHLGVRLDVRHMSTVSDITIPGAGSVGLAIGGTKLNFWRFTFGLAVH
jgi:Outer membrane protein beta-barrel domain